MKRKKKKMSKKQFAETMAQELNRYFEETLTMEVHATIREFVKTNDYTHYAIVLERPGVYALPALNVDIFYEGYKHGDSIESLSRTLAWNAMGAIMTPPPVNGMNGIPKKDFGVKLSARVVSKRRNEKYLEDVPCRDVVPGITMFASVEIIVEDMDSWQCRITNPMMKEMEYQPDELIDEALMLSEEYYPPMLMTFSDGNAEGENLLEKEGYAMNDDSMYILTTNRFRLGAVALFYPGVAEKIAEMAGGNFYAIPSSVHEFIFCRKAISIPKRNCRRCWRAETGRWSPKTTFCRIPFTSTTGIWDCSFPAPSTAACPARNSVRPCGVNR